MSMKMSRIAYAEAPAIDGSGQQHREEQGRLPQVAALALPEQEGGVAGRGGAEDGCRNRHDLESVAGVGSSKEDHTASSAANTPST